MEIEVDSSTKEIICRYCAPADEKHEALILLVPQSKNIKAEAKLLADEDGKSISGFKLHKSGIYDIAINTNLKKAVIVDVTFIRRILRLNNFHLICSNFATIPKIEYGASVTINIGK